MQQTPIIKLLTVNNKYYVYDFNTNKILSIPFDLYCVLKKNDKFSIANYKDNVSIKHLIEKGYLSGNVVEEIYNPEVDYVHYMLKTHVSNLILQVTQSCNFKCRYCSFATDNEYDRHHTNNQMCWDIARRAIDFLFENSKDLNSVNIGFYGGEPLLNYKIIRNCIIYANRLFKLKHINYSLTTNAALLNESMIAFFEENNVSIHISIDGPKHIDDKHRRFLTNGRGTFDLVDNNIRMIRDKFSNYFDNNVYFISVIYPDENVEEVYNYFKSLEVATERVNIRPVNSFATDLKFDEEALISLYDNNDKVNEFEGENYEKFIKKIKRSSNISKSTHPNGMCVPGRDKLYVTVDGKFFPCEKVNENNSYIEIGNITEGVNESKVIELVNLPKITEYECKECWALRFCEICICHCEDYTCGISKKAKLQECENQKQKIEKYMTKYILEKEGVCL